jgi:hypothetical protein
MQPFARLTSKAGKKALAKIKSKLNKLKLQLPKDSYDEHVTKLRNSELEQAKRELKEAKRARRKVQGKEDAITVAEHYNDVLHAKKNLKTAKYRRKRDLGWVKSKQRRHQVLAREAYKDADMVKAYQHEIGVEKERIKQQKFKSNASVETRKENIQESKDSIAYYKKRIKQLKGLQEIPKVKAAKESDKTVALASKLVRKFSLRGFKPVAGPRFATGDGGTFSRSKSKSFTVGGQKKEITFKESIYFDRDGEPVATAVDIYDGKKQIGNASLERRGKKRAGYVDVDLSEPYQEVGIGTEATKRAANNASMIGFEKATSSAINPRSALISMKSDKTKVYGRPEWDDEHMEIVARKDVLDAMKKHGDKMRSGLATETDIKLEDRVRGVTDPIKKAVKAGAGAVGAGAATGAAIKALTDKDKKAVADKIKERQQLQVEKRAKSEKYGPGY